MVGVASDHVGRFEHSPVLTAETSVTKRSSVPTPGQAGHTQKKQIRALPTPGRGQARKAGHGGDSSFGAAEEGVWPAWRVWPEKAAQGRAICPGGQVSSRRGGDCVQAYGHACARFLEGRALLQTGWTLWGPREQEEGRQVMEEGPEVPT